MFTKFELVKHYLHEMELPIVFEDEQEELVVVQDDEIGIHHMVIDCESPILILEQVIMPVSTQNAEVYKRLLQMNRALVHGAFVLDEKGENVIFRDTLQLENLDRNELEASVKALELGIAEFGAELLRFAKAE